ncbi:MAG: hypothetical protein FWC95_04275 [Defluviitaleaceae bacterium]|nr:hypothetical protein [Defluviitaleaceae bacterium]
MRRIFIFGSSGSGKTTLAKQLGKLLSLQVHHCDRIRQIENWDWKPLSEIHALVSEIINGDKWILEGYPTAEMIPACLARADVIIFTDLNRFLCMYRVLKRSFRYHGKVREDVGDGCKEGFPPLGLCRVIWRFRREWRQRCIGWLFACNKPVHHLKSRRQVQRFINKINSAYHTI